jgi:hypothetical protein
VRCSAELSTKVHRKQVQPLIRGKPRCTYSDINKFFKIECDVLYFKHLKHNHEIIN